MKDLAKGGVPPPTEDYFALETQIQNLGITNARSISLPPLPVGVTKSLLLRPTPEVLVLVTCSYF